jgi:hypothetical protein
MHSTKNIRVEYENNTIERVKAKVIAWLCANLMIL